MAMASSRHEEVDESISDLCKKVVLIPNKNIDRITPLVISSSILSGLPYIVQRYWCPEFACVLGSLLKEGFDLIHCSHLHIAHYMRSYDDLLYSLDEHNIETSIWERMTKKTSNPFKKLLYYWQTSRMRKYERNCCAHAGAISCVSVQDKIWILRNTRQRNVTVIENGVNLSYYKEQPDIETEPKTLVFVGSMDWYPNSEGIVQFYRRIWPKLKKKVPGIKMYVVGRNPSEQIRGFSKDDKNFIVTGQVDDVRPYIQRAGLYVVPLYIGGGTRPKIFQAFAMKKCVVSTVMGAEGIDYYDGENILIARDDRHFIEAIVSCLENPEVVRIIEDQAFQLVRSKYDWDKIGKKFNNSLP